MQDMPHIEDLVERMYFYSILKKLPDYYVTKAEAEDAGWKNWKGNLHIVLPPGK